MSLKTFHIVFVVLSVIVTAGFGAWAMRTYGAGGAGGYLAMGLGSFVVAAALVVYGIRFFHKLRRMGTWT